MKKNEQKSARQIQKELVKYGCTLKTITKKQKRVKARTSVCCGLTVCSAEVKEKMTKSEMERVLPCLPPRTTICRTFILSLCRLSVSSVPSANLLSLPPCQPVAVSLLLPPSPFLLTLLDRQKTCEEQRLLSYTSSQKDHLVFAFCDCLHSINRKWHASSSWFLSLLESIMLL